MTSRTPSDAGAAQRGAVAGFTLLELMVVLVIIAVIVAATALSLGARGFDNELDREGRRLAALLDLASEEAILQGREMGVEFVGAGYLFHRFDHETGEWVPLASDRHFGRREIPDGLEFTLIVEGRRAELRAAPAETPRPQVMLLSSGELTPFTLEMRRPQQAVLTLASDAVGSIEITREEGSGR